MSNIFQLHPEEDNLKQGKLVFSRIKQMKRRVQFLIGLRDKWKIIRGRTVHRCIEVIQTKWALLSESLHAFRGPNMQILDNILDIFVKEIIIHWYIKPWHYESVFQYLRSCQPSIFEYELILRMLEKVWVNYKDFQTVLSWWITHELQLIDNQEVYKLMRKISRDDVHNIIKSLKGPLWINKW